MINCKEASYLASKQLDHKLTGVESFQLLLHFCVCKMCRRYGFEIKKLHQMMKKAGKTSLSLLPETVKLSIKARKRIKIVLDKAIQKNNLK